MILELWCSVIVFLLIWIIRVSCKQTDGPPLADGAYPIVGHAWLAFVKKEYLYNALLGCITKTSLRTGDRWAVLRLGIYPIYMCTDPEEALLVLNSCLKKDIVYDFMIPAFGGTSGLINADEPTWKAHRKVLNPTMNQSVLNTYLTEFNDHSRQLVKMLKQEAGKEPFNHIVYLKQSLLNIICATIMGVNMKEDESLILEFGKATETYTDVIVQRFIKFYYHSDFIFNWSNLKKKQDVAVTVGHGLIKEVIKRAKTRLSAQEANENGTSGPQLKSLIDQLLVRGESGAFTDSEILQEVSTFMIAAFDTTSHVIGMTLLNIGSYPAVQQKVADELQSVFEGSLRDADKQDLSNLKYLEAVTKETMRLYPVVVTIGRSSDKDVKLKGYTIPAGSRCFVSIYHLGRHAVWGPDADQFRPERWLDGSVPRDTKAFAAFSLGRRSCIGSNFAMMLMKTVLCHVVRAYRVSGDVTRVVQSFDVVVTPLSGHHISLQRRDCLRQ